MTTKCTGCGDHQSGDLTGLCYLCRISEPGYRAQLDARVIEGMTREYDANPDWKVRQPRTTNPSRSIGDPVVYADCPGCGWSVPVGFERNDPGAETREPRPCGPCQTAELAEAEAGGRAGATEEMETHRNELELSA